MMIWGMIVWMVYEAINRIIEPVEVDGKFMLGTAIFGFVCNLVMMNIIHS